MTFKLNILGTASALPTTSRYPSAQVLEVRGRFFLIDCGEGAQMQMRRMGISPLKIESVFISHIHGDHIFGIFGLLSTMGMLGRTTGLKIFAPKSFGPVLKFFLSYFGEGLKFSIEHIVLHPSQGPEIIGETRNLEFLSFPLNHRIETYGFIIREKVPALNVRKEAIAKYGFTLAEIGAVKRGEDVVRQPGPDCGPSVENGFVKYSGTGEVQVIPNSEVAYTPYIPRSYAYCSDTAPFPELSEWLSGVTLLYHETTFPASMAEMADATNHSTTLQAAECARKAGVKKLLVGHYSSRFDDLSVFLNEVRSIFADADLTKEGMTCEIPLKKFH